MSRLTPMQRRQLRVAATSAGTAAALTGQQQALQWLHTQRGLLAALQSRQAREAHKAQVLPEIAPYLEGVLQANAGGQDPIVSYCTVWALDAGNWPLALALGEYAVDHGIDMPDEFKRTAPTLLLDLMADAALTGRMSADEISPYLRQALLITEGANMPDQSPAKTHKAIAYGLAGKTTLAGQSGDWKGLSPATLAMALEHLTTAEQLDQNAGVKKDIAAVQKLLGQAAPAAAETPTASNKPAAKKAAAKRGKKP